MSSTNAGTFAGSVNAYPMSRCSGGSESMSGLVRNTRGQNVGRCSADRAMTDWATISSPASRTLVTPLARNSGRNWSPVTCDRLARWTRCTCASIKPGSTNLPRQSSTSAFGGRHLRPGHGTDAVPLDDDGPVRHETAGDRIEHRRALKHERSLFACPALEDLADQSPTTIVSITRATVSRWCMCIAIADSCFSCHTSVGSP